jgi:hypothetical protein
MESDRNRQLFVEKVLTQSPSELEETSITAMATLDDTYPSLLRTSRAQRDNPNRGSTRGNEPAREALRIGTMRFVPMAATTRLIRAKRLNPKSFALQATGVLGCSPMRDHIDGRFLPLCPTTHEQHRTLRCTGPPPLRSRKAGSWLETRPQGVETTGRAVPPRRPVATRAAHRRPACVLPGWLQARPLAGAIAKAHHRRTLREQPAHPLDQGAREVRGTGSLRPLAHPSGQRQGSAGINHGAQQGVAPAPHDAAIHAEPQRLEGERTAQEVRIR